MEEEEREEECEEQWKNEVLGFRFVKAFERPRSTEMGMKLDFVSESAAQAAAAVAIERVFSLGEL